MSQTALDCEWLSRPSSANQITELTVMPQREDQMVALSGLKNAKKKDCPKLCWKAKRPKGS